MPLLVPLARYREHVLDHRAVRWFFERQEPEEGANGGEAQVARSDAHAASHLEISQECADKGRIQIIEQQG
jgi:hypothetical protein